MLGTLYAYVEQCFRSLLRIGFASRFTVTSPDAPRSFPGDRWLPTPGVRMGVLGEVGTSRPPERLRTVTSLAAMTPEPAAA